MGRFISLIWNKENEQETAAARQIGQILTAPPDWAMACAAPGLQIFYNQKGPRKTCVYHLEENGGTVIGTLFRHTGGKALDPETVSLGQLSPKTLLTDYWGRYVAFLKDDDGPAWSIVRDPSGQMPCFHVRMGALHIYASDLADLVLAMGEHPLINWRFVLAFMLVRELVIEETGLQNITEVLPGTCHTICADRHLKRPLWEPHHYGGNTDSMDFTEASGALRRTVQLCTAAWAGQYGKIIHNLSGGLDSAIVLSCLRASRPSAQILCLTYYTAAVEGDERTLARLAADFMGCQLVEVPMSVLEDLTALLEHHPLAAAPDGSIFGKPTKDRQKEIAVTYQAEAFFSGEGGDHLFYQMASDLIAADYARTHSHNLMAVIAQTAARTGSTFWSVVRTVLHHGYLRRPWSGNIQSPTDEFPFIRATAYESVTPDYTLHPWSRAAAHLPPGKAYQIHALPKVLHRQEQSPRAEVADIVHPLLSQPVMEHVLRLPSYTLTYGGEGRALARAAFKTGIPQAIRQRHSKGSTTSHFAYLAAKNLPLIRTFLLDGILSQQDFIDRKGLEEFLRPERLQRATSIPAVYKLLATESWLSVWRGSSSK